MQELASCDYGQRHGPWLQAADASCSESWLNGEFYGCNHLEVLEAEGKLESRPLVIYVYDLLKPQLARARSACRMSRGNWQPG